MFNVTSCKVYYERFHYMMWGLHLPRTILAVAFGCWCFQLTQECNTTHRCSEICEYSDWAKHAVCGQRHLEEVPQVCCGVKSLDVRHNSIRVLRKGALENFTRLKYLYLDSNNMSVVRKGAFQGCSKLEHLSLGDNNFRSLTRRMTEGLERIKYLMMSGGKLKRTDRDVFQETPSLLTLDLQGNQLVSPPCDALPAGNILKVVFLSRNRISLIPRLCFQNFTKLERLQLNDNPICSITNVSAFQGLESLKELNLRNTSLSVIPVAMFRNIHTTTTLIMSQNLIESLHERDFMGLPYLTTLNLEYNRIATIHEKAFSGLDFLETLVLSNNRIVSVGQGAFFPVEGTLRDLHLHGNRLPAIQNISSSFTSLERIFIADNPVVCSCHLAPLRQWLQLNRDVLSSTEGNATCKISESYRKAVPILESNQTYPCLQTTTVTLSRPEEEISTIDIDVSTHGSIPDGKGGVLGISIPRVFLIIVSISFGVIVVSMMLLLVVYFKALQQRKLKDSKSDDSYATIIDNPMQEIMPFMHDSRIFHAPIYSTRIRRQDCQNDLGNGFRVSSSPPPSPPSQNSPGSPTISNSSIRNAVHTHFNHPTYRGQTLTSNIQHNHGTSESGNILVDTVAEGDDGDLNENNADVISKKGITRSSHRNQRPVCFNGDSEMNAKKDIRSGNVDSAEEDQHSGDDVDGGSPSVADETFHETLWNDGALSTRTDLNNCKTDKGYDKFPEKVLAGPVNVLWTQVSKRKGLRKDHGHILQQSTSPGMWPAQEESFCTTYKQLITTV